MFRDASCFKRDIHNDASVTQIVSARWGETVVDLPRLLGETNQARELASAGPIRCAGLRYPAGLIRPLSLQRATPVQSKKRAQGCHREREGCEGFFKHHCSLLSLNRHSPDSLPSDGTEKTTIFLSRILPVSTENSPRLYIFPHHLLRSRTVGGTPVGSHSDKHGVRKNRSTLAIHSPGRI